MEGLVGGDVVVVPFPFTNLSSQKVRPALVLASLDRGDVLLCQITSKHSTHRAALPLVAVDFLQGGLPMESFVLPQRLVTASSAVVRRLAGKISAQKLGEIRLAVCEVVQGRP